MIFVYAILDIFEQTKRPFAPQPGGSKNVANSQVWVTLKDVKKNSQKFMFFFFFFFFFFFCFFFVTPLKRPYIRIGSTDLHRIWNDDAYWHCKAHWQLKFQIFVNPLLSPLLPSILLSFFFPLLPSSSLLSLPNSSHSPTLPSLILSSPHPPFLLLDVGPLKSRITDSPIQITILNQALHFNGKTVYVYHRLCIFCKPI